MKAKHVVAALICALLLVAVIVFIRATPAVDRDWKPDQQILAISEFDGDLVHISNVRNFTFYADDNFTISYYNATYNLSDLRSVEYMVEPFAAWEGISHTMVTFGFADGRYVVVSVEQRREKGEQFSIINGLLNQYELVYMIADESDAVRVRTNYRLDPIRMYPMNLSSEHRRAFFTRMLERANKLTREPEFYNAITSTCTTNLLEDLGASAGKNVPWGFEVMFPGYSDWLLYRLGFLDTELPFPEAKTHYSIEARARACGDCAEFSRKIRE